MDNEIVINRFDGLVPGYWKNPNPSFGNAGHASDLQHVDLTDPSVLTQGPGLVDLTAGTQAGAVTTLIKGIQRISIDGTYIYGTGGNKFYRITTSAVSNSGDWPHTIDKAAVTAELGEDVCYYKGNYYYSYNHSASQGDVGRYTGAAFDDDYMSTIPTTAGVLVGGVPHQMVVGGDDKMYIANGHYVASLETTTFTAQALNLPIGEQISSLVWDHNRIYAFSNIPNTATNTYMNGSIYLWDTNATSWEYQITVPGKTGGSFSKNGIVYFFYQDVSSSAQFKLAYVDGNAIKDVAQFSGTLPGYHQVIINDNHITWLSAGEVWAWGAASNDLPVKLFQYADGGHINSGGITNAFGTPIMASQDASTNYRVAKFSGYDVNAQWKSITYDLSTTRGTAYIDRIMVETEALAVGAACDMTITYDYGSGTETATTVQIAYDASDTTKTRWVVNRKGIGIENFRVDLAWANGSATNPVKIRKIMIGVRTVTNQ